MREALLYDPLPEGAVACRLCRHRCRIAPGHRGLCHVRENRNGRLYSLNYGMVVAEHADPVEKKPLYHFLPGTQTYSIATVGCNFTCRHCQNYSIAQDHPDPSGTVRGNYVPPEEIVRRAVSAGCRSLSFTYTEPTVFFEYALDTARLAVKAGLKNIFVTNGYITPEALDMIGPFLHGANIDLKGFSDEFYRRIVGGRLAEVLECIRDYRSRGVWIELTTLVIPGENDSEEQLDGAARFIAERLGVEVPWHISRFFPQYKMTDRVPTPVSLLARALEAGRRHGLRYVYTGNCDDGAEDTICPGCGHAVIERSGYRLRSRDLVAGACRSCGTPVDGVW